MYFYSTAETIKFQLVMQSGMEIYKRNNIFNKMLNRKRIILYDNIYLYSEFSVCPNTC